MRKGNRVLLLLGSSLMLSEMVALFRSLPDVTIIGASPGSRLPRTLKVSRDIDAETFPVFPKIRNVRDVDIPKIIHLKQPRHSAHNNLVRSFARGSQDIRVSVPRTKPRKRNGSR